jgi:hypothetical protein
VPPNDNEEVAILVPQASGEDIAVARLAAADAFGQALAQPATQTSIAILVIVTQISQPFAQSAAQSVTAILVMVAPIRQPFAQPIP